jgi:hypothetical protein
MRHVFKQGNNLVLEFWPNEMFTTPYLIHGNDLTINFVVNAASVAFPAFYVFKGSKRREDYIKLCRLKTCMAKQKKVGL